MRQEFADARSVADFPEFPPASQPTVSVDGIVGGDSQSLGPTNTGYAMLAKMGWSPGESLGLRGEGRVDPISVLKRPKPRSGFGS